MNRPRRVEPANLTFQLRSFVLLIGRRFRQLLCRIGAAFFQISRRWYEALVFYSLPLHQVVMPNNRNTARAQNLITAGMVEMVVAVDGVLNGELCLRFDYFDQFR